MLKTSRGRVTRGEIKVIITIAPLLRNVETLEEVLKKIAQTRPSSSVFRELRSTENAILPFHRVLTISCRISSAKYVPPSNDEASTSFGGVTIVALIPFFVFLCAVQPRSIHQKFEKRRFRWIERIPERFSCPLKTAVAGQTGRWVLAPKLHGVAMQTRIGPLS